MKIMLLEHPRSISRERLNDVANTPLSSCLLTGYIAAVLKAKGYEVEIVEGYLEGLSYDQIEERLEVLRPDILGVHMVYQWRKEQELFDFLEKVKKEGPAPYITAYGFYPTLALEEILSTSWAIDSVILGEPELTFGELAEALSCGIFPRDLPGLAVREGDSVRFLWRDPLDDLDLLPFPLRTEAMFRLPQVNIQGSRGCYGRCTFCYINPFYGPNSRWRGRSPENIVAEIDTIVSARDFRDFYFVDANFFGPGKRGQERARRLASLLKGRDIRFGIEARVNDIYDEVIGELVEAGLYQIFLGLESGSERSLKRMNKMTTVEQNERALSILRKYGLEPNLGFIMFEPDATLEDVRDNFDFLKRNGLLKDLAITANVLYHYQIILKGTPAYHKLYREGRLEISPSSSYEGRALFVDPRVAALAKLMQHLTNFLFLRMEGIWSGKVKEPPDAQGKYAELNHLLVNVFEEALSTLEKGPGIGQEELDTLAEKKQKEIEKITQLLYRAAEV